MSIDRVEKRRGPGHEADADSGREDLAEAVEAQDAADAAITGLCFEHEIGRDARAGAKVHEVIGVVLCMMESCEDGYQFGVRKGYM